MVTAQSFEQVARMAQWERKSRGPLARSHHDAGAELLQPERSNVDPVAHRRVGRVEQLEASVTQETIDAVSPDPAADSITGLENDDLRAAALCAARALQASKTSPDNDDVGVHESPNGCVQN